MTFNADDVDSELTTKDEMENCLKDMLKWMAEYKRKMNNSKTEVILYGTIKATIIQSEHQPHLVV